MSTKTTFKRVALVAVAALGLGVLTSVSPAFAGERTATSITAGAPSVARAGAAVTSTITLGFAAALASGDTTIVSAKVISAPATSKHITATATVNASAATLGFAASAAGFTASATSSDRSAASFGAYTTAASGVFTNDSSNVTTGMSATMSFTPDVAGTYQIMVSAGTGTTYTSGDVSTIVTVTTAGAPVSVTLSSVTSSPATDGQGAIVKVVAKDAAGVATTLLPGEGVTVTSSSTTSIMTVMTSTSSNTASSGSATSVSLTDANFLKGTGYIRVVNSVEETAVLTATSNGTLGTSLVSTLSVAYTAPTLVAGSAATLSKPTTATSGYKSGTAAGSYIVYTQPKTATSSTIQLNYNNASATTTLNTTAAVAALQVTDTSGKITGIAGAIFDVAVSVAAEATKGSVSFSHALSTAGQGYSAVLRTVTAGTSTAFALTSATSDATASGAAAAVVGQTSVLSATGGTTTWKISTKDQFAVLKGSTPVTLTITGRNAAKSGIVVVTDATGYGTFTLVDAGTVGTTDSLSFTAGGSATAATATVNYGTYTVGTVTVTGGSDLETIAGSTLTAISAGDDPSTGARNKFTATVKDASGNLISGVPVTFSVSGLANSAIVKTSTLDYSTVYTGADGKAISYAFAWGLGKMTVTATAGGKTGTQYLTFGSAAATGARVLSASVSGTTVSVKVVDRYGNPVDGVTVNLSRVGTGTFGTGSTTQDIKTDATGTAEAQFSGKATIKAKLGDTYTQAYDLAGEINAVAVTAAVAGATTGTGATLAPVGVYSVTVEVDATTADSATNTAQTAADAAAEATDAANAATDAANAAAEAADAATAAAQDAADAVAALSAQVASLISGLKAQLTALTNLVIKIQKKVKA